MKEKDSTEGKKVARNVFVKHIRCVVNLVDVANKLMAVHFGMSAFTLSLAISLLLQFGDACIRPRSLVEH